MKPYEIRIYTNMRIMNSVLRRWSLFVLFVFLFVIRSYAQEDVKNLPKYDRQFPVQFNQTFGLHFGFSLGLNVAHFRTQLVDDFRFRDTVFSVTPHGVAGLNLGIIFNLHMGDKFDLRFIPGLAFTQRNLEYNLIYPDSVRLNNETITKKVESTYLEFPLDLKFKSARINNYRVYVVAGAKYGIDMISQAKVEAKDKEIVKLDHFDYGYEIGLGFDFYMTYFKFSPEIKMFNGLNNLLVQDNRTFSKPLKGLYSKTFLVSFTFE